MSDLSDLESLEERPALPIQQHRSPSSAEVRINREGHTSTSSPFIPPSPSDDDSVVPATPRIERSIRQELGSPLTPLSELGELPSNINQVPLDDGIEESPLNQEPAIFEENQQARIRGTDVHVPTAAAAFTDFLRSFKSLQFSRQRSVRPQNDGNLDAMSVDADSDDDIDHESERENISPLYRTRLVSLLQHGVLLNNDSSENATASLEIDSIHIYYHSPECQKFYHQLVAYPMELVPLMDIVVQRELEILAASETTMVPMIPRVQVRPFNLKQVSNLRCLDPVAIDSLVSIKGMIVRLSPIIPDLKVAHFSCSICGHSVQVTIDRGRIAEPNRCPICSVNAYQIVHNRSIYADKQLVRIQETPDEVPAGQTPASVVTFCFDDLVDSVQPGDKVEVTGVLRAQPIRVHPKITKMKSVYKTYVDVIHFRKITGMETSKKDDLAEHGGKAQWTDERIRLMKELSRRPDIYDQLTLSLAPSIWELDNVKRGILCMLFGGNHVRVKQAEAPNADANTDQPLPDDESGNNRHSKLNKRGDINILLCGDPGTSKSQLLSYVNKLSARGVYTSGKGSSAVGLTASVVRDPETRELVLESGALVLSDLGICCIDEFDKMGETTRSVLHEAMEQQTVSVAKAGIIASLHARTSVLASANPAESRYNPSRSVVDNIQLPPTLLSRFDLIYLILDSPNVENDRRLAQHLVGLYYETPNVVEPPLDQSLLRDYIQYARENIHPEISDEAAEQLISSYLEMRNPGGRGGVAQDGRRTISATPRQLESLIRLSEALAKMKFSSVVTRADAIEAVRLMKVATQTAATDPRTGRIDMDMITTGRSSSDREMEEQVEISLRELLTERRGNRVAIRDVSRQLSEITNTMLSSDQLLQALRRLEADGWVQLNERAQTVFVRTGVGRL